MQMIILSSNKKDEVEKNTLFGSFDAMARWHKTISRTRKGTLLIVRIKKYEEDHKIRNEGGSNLLFRGFNHFL